MTKYAVRRPDEVARGMEQARSVLASGDATVAAYLLDESVEALELVSGSRAESAKS